MGSGRGVVAVSTCVSGTRGSDVLSSTGDVLEMSVVRGVGGVCDMLLGAVWVWVYERIGFYLYQSCGDMGSVGDVSVFWLRWCGWCGWCRWGVGSGLDQGRERWGGVMSV